MKKLMVAAMAAAVFTAFADEPKAETETQTPATEAEQKDDGAPLFWGFGNTGIYSGYQLYGSLVNSQPTWQTYLEGDVNLRFGDVDLGYLGIGLWFNSDLTSRRHQSYGRFFNEFDPNIHWGKTFWFDDDRTWGLDYRTTVVWYYYPHHEYQDHPAWGETKTTMDWNHSFSILNPYVVPFLDVVHEYHESDGNLLQGGLKKTVGVTDDFSVTPSATFVWRNSHYNWCFPTDFGDVHGWGAKHGSGVATMKLEIDVDYKIAANFGLFAKVAYCSVIDPDLRDNCDDMLHGNAYGDKKDFAWGGVGLTWNF